MQSPRNSHRNPLAPLAGFKVLILAEDQQSQTDVIGYLNSVGAEVCHLASHQALIQALKNSPELFDVVILALENTPSENILVTQVVRGNGYEGVLLSITDLETADLFEILQTLGLDQAFVKPFKMDRLILAITQQFPSPTLSIDSMDPYSDVTLVQQTPFSAR